MRRDVPTKRLYEENKQGPKMVIKFLLFLAYLIYAGYILYGEIGLNSYGAKQGALNRIDQAEKLETQALMQSPEMAAQLAAYNTRIANLNKNNETKNALNVAAAKARGVNVKPFDESVTTTDERVNRIQNEQKKFIAEKIKPIATRFAERRERVKSDSSLISLGFAMPCAALFLCLFSAWVYPQGTQFKQNYGLQTSFVAQGMSCIITFDAVMIQQGVWLKAVALSLGALIAIPSGHYFAGLLWRQIQLEWKEWRQAKARGMELKPVEDRPRLRAEVNEHTEEESLIHRKTIRSSKTELQVPVSQVLKNVEPTTYEEACRMKKKGMLQMSVREIADKFNVKKWQVEAALKTTYALPSPSDKAISVEHKTVSD